MRVRSRQRLLLFLVRLHATPTVPAWLMQALGETDARKQVEKLIQ
jgi:hypothetical protein